MEHSEGATLADAISRAPFPVQELLRRAIDLASALNQLHRQGHIHGAVEPAAILLIAAGVELAEPAAAPRSVTPYTAPEQLSGITDARSDIFALGAVIYEMATGRKAFAGDTQSALEAAILETQPPSLATPGQNDKAAAFYTALDRVVSDCLVKSPDRRRQRVHNVLVDLKLMSAAARAASPKLPAAPPQWTPVQLEQRGVEQPVQPSTPDHSTPTVETEASGGADRPVNAETVPLEVPPAESEMKPAGVTAVPTPCRKPAVLPDPMQLSKAPLEGETAAAQRQQREAGDISAMAERRAAAILSQVGFGQPAPYVVGPAELKERRRAKEKREEPQAGPVESRKQTQGETARISIQFEPERQKRHRVPSFKTAAALAVAALVAFAGWAANNYLRKPSSGLGVLRFALPAPEQASYMSSPAISPDGKLLAFSAAGPDKKRLLWIRPLSSLKAEWLANTEDAMAPFWSPDGKYIAFFAGKKLKKVPVDGGPVTVLCETEGLAGGGAWSRDDVIVFGRSFYDGLYRIPAGGGTPERVTMLDSSRGERAHLWPVFLPDGRHFVFYALAELKDNNGISAGSLDSKATRHLLSADTNALYAERPAAAGKKGYLLYGHSHRLTAQAFDPVTLTPGEEQFTVADEFNYLDLINLLPISTAANGVLAYQSIDAPKRQLVWFDRDGNQVGVLGEPADYKHVRISPDGREVAVNRQAPDKDTADIWLFDVDSNRGYPFTAEATHEGAPVWSPDGRELVYFSNPQGRFDLFKKRMGTASRQEPVLVTGADKYASDWSADGKYLLYCSDGGGTNWDLWVLPLKGKGSDPFPYLQTVNNEGYAQFSPDGKWVAYQSDETGRGEVYVEPFPRVDGRSRRWQISTAGGGLPKWRGDGKELYYMMGNGRMMAVSVNTREGLTPSAPRMLFQTRALPRDWNMFDATPDGRRFLVNTPLEWATSSPITVVADWSEGFNKP